MPPPYCVITGIDINQIQWDIMLYTTRLHIEVSLYHPYKKKELYIYDARIEKFNLIYIHTNNIVLLFPPNKWS